MCVVYNSHVVYFAFILVYALDMVYRFGTCYMWIWNTLYAHGTYLMDMEYALQKWNPRSPVPEITEIQFRKSSSGSPIPPPECLSPPQKNIFGIRNNQKGWLQEGFKTTPDVTLTCISAATA